MKLDEQLAAKLAEGYELVQEGTIAVPYDPNAKPKPTFTDRVATGNPALIGSGDCLLDDDERWFHLRKPAAVGHR